MTENNRAMLAGILCALQGAKAECEFLLNEYARLLFAKIGGDSGAVVLQLLIDSAQQRSRYFSERIDITKNLLADHSDRVNIPNGMSAADIIEAEAAVMRLLDRTIPS